MPAKLEILPEDVQRFATLARALIDRRLALIPESSRPQFWAIIANVYGRGLARDVVSGNLLQALPEIADGIRSLDPD
jgi:hypothetical protein